MVLVDPSLITGMAKTKQISKVNSRRLVQDSTTSLVQSYEKNTFYNGNSFQQITTILRFMSEVPTQIVLSPVQIASFQVCILKHFSRFQVIYLVNTEFLLFQVFLTQLILTIIPFLLVSELSLCMWWKKSMIWSYNLGTFVMTTRTKSRFSKMTTRISLSNSIKISHHFSRKSPSL